MTRTWVLLVASATALLTPRPADASLFRRDSDGDGIRNRHDECPFEAEDFDDFEDDDGCPDELPGSVHLSVVDAAGQPLTAQLILPVPPFDICKGTCTLELAPGPQTISIIAQGYDPAKAQFDLSEDEVKSIEVVLTAAGVTP